MKIHLLQYITRSLIIGAMSIVPFGASALAEGADMTKNIDAGRTLAFDRAKGNCLACHALPGGTMAGDVGPALPMKGVTFQQMFQTKEKLVAFLADPEKMFPYANMPEFGKNKVLTHEELGLIADYLWSLK